MKHNCSFCSKNYIGNQEMLGHFNNCGCGKQGVLDQDINGQFYVHCFDYHICTKKCNCANEARIIWNEATNQLNETISFEDDVCLGASMNFGKEE